MPTTYQPLTIKSITFKNRIGLSPMCQYSAKNGIANDWHFVHYGTRAVGGVGLVLIEATAVVPEGRITPLDLGIWNNKQIIHLRRITDFIHKQGSVAGIQIGHAGRKASHASPNDGGRQLNENEGGWVTVGPSPLPFAENENAPKELSRKEIRIIVRKFKEGAKRSNKAGFKVLEIHAAHGYLLHQFLSPLSNTRTDKYGGSFENRIRFLLEVIVEVQKAWPIEYPLFVRISATDWTDGGWTLEEAIKLSKILFAMGVDLIDCSSGGNVVNANIPLDLGYQVFLSEAIRKTGILTSTVGLINSHQQIEDILETNKADLVLLGRVLLRNPYFPLHPTINIKDSKWPVQYLRAK